MQGPMSTLRGQTAVVTGGGRGIGRAIALELAAAGARVIVVSRSKPELEETVALVRSLGGDARCRALDVTDEAAVFATFDEIENEFGCIDALVNNAGIAGPIEPFVESNMQTWWRTVDVNLRGPVLCSSAVLPGMTARKRGRIVNITTSAIPIAYFSSYVTSKAALMRFTETIAAELLPQGVYVFAVGPGTVRTAMSEHSLTSEQGRSLLPWFARIFEEGYSVLPDRPAQLVLKLLLGEADELTGRLLTIGDDLQSMCASVDEIQERHLYALAVTTLDEPDANAARADIRTAAARGAGYALRLEHTFEASPEKVFALWTDARAVEQWYVDRAAVHWRTAPLIDARPNGSYDIRVASDDDRRFEFSGVYYEVTPPTRLVFTWAWQQLPIPGAESVGETLVTVRFFQNRDVTRMVLMQAGLPTEGARDAHVRGWNRCFDGMARILNAPADVSRKAHAL